MSPVATIQGVHMRESSLYVSGTVLDSLFVFWCDNNGDSLVHHDLVGAVTVQVHTGHECCLSGVCLGEGQKELR